MLICIAIFLNVATCRDKIMKPTSRYCETVYSVIIIFPSFSSRLLTKWCESYRCLRFERKKTCLSINRNNKELFHKYRSNWLIREQFGIIQVSPFFIRKSIDQSNDTKLLSFCFIFIFYNTFLTLFDRTCNLGTWRGKALYDIHIFEKLLNRNPTCIHRDNFNIISAQWSSTV